MKRVGCIVTALSLLIVSACAVNEPGPKKIPIDDDGTVAGDAKDNPTVVMETSKGTVKILLFQDKAPISVKNFLRYVEAKHYDGTIFHRVIKGFMIQGGGFEPGLREKTDKFAPIKNEAGNGLRNVRGTLAMARTNDPDSATAQFFINTVDNPNLDRRPGSAGYAVFGKVIEGMSVVDEIEDVRAVNRGGHEKVPVDDVMIRSIRRMETKEPTKEPTKESK